MTRRILSAALVVAALAGCRGETSTETPIVPIRNMYDQPRYDSQASSTYFQDGRTMRPPVEGTVAREEEIDPLLATGREETGTYTLAVPQPIVQRAGGVQPLLERGHERFDIYCSPCHSRTGDGNGMVVQRGFQRPPSLHDERIRHMPDGQVFATVSEGLRNMPSYRAQIPVQDRWAIVAYVRALELTQAQAANP